MQILIRGGKFNAQEICQAVEHGGMLAIKDGDAWELYRCRSWGGYVLADYAGSSGLKEVWIELDGGNKKK